MKNPKTAINSRGNTYLIIYSHHFPICKSAYFVFIKLFLKSLTPNLITTTATINPDTISPVPQTKSWLSKNSKLTAEGIPANATASAIYLTASFLSHPMSTKFTTHAWNVETIEVNAANDIARKKILPMIHPAVPIDANKAVK